MREEKTLEDAVVVFPVREDQVLLAVKTRKIGMGCWNGYGGGIETEETSEEAAIREVKMESGGVEAFPAALEKVAVMSIRNNKSDGSIFVCRLHYYFLYQWKGDFISTDEMYCPSWFSKNKMPYEDMMPADKYYLRFVLYGWKIIGQAEYGPFQQTLIGEVRFYYVESF